MENNCQRFFYNEFKRLRSLCKSQISRQYRLYHNKIETSIIDNPKVIFKYVHSKQGTSRIPSTMNFKDSILDSPQNIVNAFADKFSASYETVSSPVPRDSYFVNNNPVILSAVSEDDVLSVLSTLPKNNNAGDDSIPCFILRDAKNALAKPLSTLINLSIRTSVFPILWKRARVIPILKKKRQN